MTETSHSHSNWERDKSSRDGTRDSQTCAWVSRAEVSRVSRREILNAINVNRREEKADDSPSSRLWRPWCRKCDSRSVYPFCDVTLDRAFNSTFVLGGATLLFDVELINIGDSPPTTNVFKEIDDNKDKQLSRDEVNRYVRTRPAWALFFL